MIQGPVPDLRAPDCFHQGFLKGLSDGHDFSGGFHLCPQGTSGVHEFIKRPLREFHDHIVQRRFKAGIRTACHGIADFIQRKTDGNLGCHLGDRIPGRFGGQRGRPGYPGIYLDDRVFKAVRPERELAVAAAFHLQLGNDAQRRAAEHLVLFVGKRDTRRDDDTVPGMDAHRIEVLHRADRDDIARGIPHHFKLDFFPARDGFLHQHLGDRGKPEPVFRNLAQLLLIINDATAGATQCKCRTDNQGISDFLREFHGGFHIIDDKRRNDRLADGFHRILEHLTVFRFVDGFRIRAQQDDIVRFQETFLRQLHGQCQACLATECGKQPVRFFFNDDPFQDFQGQRLDINRVRHLVVGHDGRRIGIDQDDFQPFLFQRSAGLRPGVVKFRRLPDHDRTGTNDHYFFQLFI